MENGIDLSLLLTIIGLILAVLNFFISPGWVLSTINKSVLANRKKRIETLIDDYKFIAYCREKHDTLAAELIAKVANGLYQLTLFVLWVGIYVTVNIRQSKTDPLLNFNLFLTLYFLFGVLDRFNSTVQMFNNVVNIHRYKEDVIKKLTKLGGNPEDLDKDDTASPAPAREAVFWKSQKFFCDTTHTNQQTEVPRHQQASM